MLNRNHSRNMQADHRLHASILPPTENKRYTEYSDSEYNCKGLTAYLTAHNYETTVQPYDPKRETSAHQLLSRHATPILECTWRTSRQ
jgi:hypothetical protein